jgi:signal transduction histidine kinase
MAANGGERHLHLRGEPRSDPADGASRMIGTIQDVSERVAAEQAMRLAKERAEAAERTKLRLLAMASHDLRTPLTAIRGALDLLRAEPADAPDAERSELLDIAQTNVERLTALVNDLLDLARIEAGRLELRLSLVDLRMIVAEVVEALAPQAAAKGLPIEVVAPRDAPLLTGDPDRLYQVVLNLVGNAVKFTDAGGIVVTIRADGRWVELSVVDTGIGIAPDAAPHVFDEFSQEGAAARRAGGAGLGLSIVKRLVDLHGGTVRVESELGRGSVFTMRLPANPAPAAAPAASVADALAAPMAPPDAASRWVDPR